MYIFSLIILLAYPIVYCANFIKDSVPAYDTGGMKRFNYVKNKMIRYQKSTPPAFEFEKNEKRGKDYSGFHQLYYFTPLIQYEISTNTFTTLPEKLFPKVFKRYGVLGGLLLSGGGILHYNSDNSLIKQILPNVIVRMGSALITTASICVDYRLQEILKSDIDSCHKRASIKIRKLCAMNGGLYIKAAQHLASMDNILPKFYVEELVKLQDQGPASSIKVIEKVFKEEVGKEFKEVFSDICNVPS